MPVYKIVFIMRNREAAIRTTFKSGQSIEDMTAAVVSGLNDKTNEWMIYHDIVVRKSDVLGFFIEWYGDGNTE